MPADEICHEFDSKNFKRAVNRIITQVGLEEKAKAEKKAMAAAKQKRSWGR